MQQWGEGLANSWWGYLRIIDSEGKAIGGTGQITSYRNIKEVKKVMRDALKHLGKPVPSYLAS